jgi:hypothetical protein
MVMALVFMNSYHADWCHFHPECAHTDDICKDVQGAIGPSMTQLINSVLIADPDACSRGYRMDFARKSAYVCKLVPFRPFVFGLLS